MAKDKVLSILRRVSKLFKDEKSWTTSAWARTKAGRIIGSADAPVGRAEYLASKDAAACSWCMEGGVYKCSPSLPAAEAALEVLARATYRMTEKHVFVSVTTMNDDYLHFDKLQDWINAGVEVRKDQMKKAALAEIDAL